MSSLGLSMPFHTGYFNTSITVTRYTHAKQADGSFKDGSASTVYSGPARFIPGGTSEDWSRLKRETARVDGTLWVPAWTEGTETDIRVDDRVTVGSVVYQIAGDPVREGGAELLLRMPLEQEVL